MTEWKYLRETFTAEQVAEYAKSLHCSVKEAEERLEKLIVDQPC